MPVFVKGHPGYNKNANSGSFVKGQKAWNSGLAAPWTSKMNKARTGTPNLKRRRRVFIPCAVCKTIVERRPCRVKKNVLCGKKCNGLWRNTKKWRDQQSKKLKDYFKKPGSKEKMLASILSCRFPTSFEKRIIKIIKDNDLDYKYVGDGSLFIARKNPDFINCNGKKIIIETFYSYFKDKDYRVKRRRLFSKYGFRTLFLTEREIMSKNWELICLKKIKGFEN